MGRAWPGAQPRDHAQHARISPCQPMTLRHCAPPKQNLETRTRGLTASRSHIDSQRVMEAITTNEYHFVLVPWLAQGHIIPMIDIARLLAARPGVQVTVIITPANAARIQPLIDRISAAALPIRFVSLPFPAAKFGLPDGCENLDALPSRAHAGNFFAAAKLLKGPLLHHLRHHSPAPACMITGVGHPWTHAVAQELGVPRLVFHGYSCLSILSIHNLYTYKPHEAAASDSDAFPLAGLPHRIEMTRPQLPRQFHSSQDRDIYRQIREGEVTADGFVVNSFDELEPGYREWLEKATGKKAWPVGPVSLSGKATLDVAQRGNVAAIDESQCLTWLDSKENNSVIYVSFGSMCILPPSQLMELGSGLLASKQPFIWVIKAVPEGVEGWLSEHIAGNERCLSILGWAPQVMILSHPAVGGLVTHCGWNSTLEGICAGVPMVTWPLVAEQFLNEKLVVELLGVGVSLEVQKMSNWTAPENHDEVVTREEVAAAVKRVMGDGEERRRANQLASKAKRVLEEGGSSHLNLTMLMEFVSVQMESKQ